MKTNSFIGGGICDEAELLKSLGAGLGIAAGAAPEPVSLVFIHNANCRIPYAMQIYNAVKQGLGNQAVIFGSFGTGEFGAIKDGQAPKASDHSTTVCAIRFPATVSNQPNRHTSGPVHERSIMRITRPTVCIGESHPSGFNLNGAKVDVQSPESMGSGMVIPRQ
jgi:hypothetical protein